MRPSRLTVLVSLACTLVATLVPTTLVQAAPPAWVEDVNLLRELGGIGPVVEDAAWSEGSLLHAQYMARHGVMTHDEDPTWAGWTAAGDEAGNSGNVAYGYPTRREVLLGWLASPGHAFWMLNPAADRFGFGHASDRDGTDWWTLRVFDRSDVDLGVPASGGLLWPAEGAVVPGFRASLDKLSTCGDGRGGIAVYWRSRTAPAAATMTVDGRAVATCVFSYSATWHGVAAREATPAGATVVVDLVGAGMPGPRTFRVANGFGDAGIDAWPTPEARSIAPACAGVGDPADFTDVAGTLFAETISCVGGRALAEGFPDGSFRPTTRLTRGQTFAFVARMLEEVGVPRPATSPDAFADDDGTLFEDDIDWLAQLGVLPRGGAVDPRGAMRRGLMAELMRGAAEVAGEATPASSTDWFGDDDGHPYERAIGWVADEGIVLGVDDGEFRPDGVLTRGQMATFLARTLALLES